VPRRRLLDRVAEWRRGGLQVALLTNAFRGFAGIRAGAGIPDAAFDVVVESWRVGVRKPDPRIFAVVLDRLGRSPEECVFVDDEPVNVAAGRALGMDVLLAGSEQELLVELDGRLGGREGVRAWA
jgi:putative hydrolase of the HAD superfamily